MRNEDLQRRFQTATKYLSLIKDYAQRGLGLEVDPFEGLDSTDLRVVSTVITSLKQAKQREL